MAKYFLNKLDDKGNYRIVSDRTYMLKGGKLVKKECSNEDIPAMTMIDFDHEAIKEDIKYMPVGGIMVLDVK